MTEQNFTKGKIFGPLMRFTGPVILALLLQTMYGAIDLMIVGKFATSADVSGVSTGSQIMMTFTSVAASFSTGATILLGQQIGMGKGKEAGKTIGAGIVLFAGIAICLSLFLFLLASPISTLMNAPVEAFDKTVQYVRICGAGTFVIVAYNLIGSIFRGIGDSTTPLITVAIASVVNIFGDLALVAGFNMGAAGAALATVGAQLISVLLSLVFIAHRKLPFDFHKSDIQANGSIMKRITSIGAPIAIQDFLVGLSFMVILAIVNNLGLTVSAGIGVAEKVCAFIMLVPMAFSQSVAAFTSQNVGALQFDRAQKGLTYAISTSLVFGFILAYLAFFHGSLLNGFFTNDTAVIQAASEYLKAYAIDTILVSLLFCFIGYFNGFGLTKFVMIQGIIGAFLVRIPVSYIMAGIEPVSLFRIGLATPASSFVQILLCFGCSIYVKKKVIPEMLKGN